MGIVTQIVTQIMTLLWAPSWQQINYIKDLKENVQTLKKNMDELTSIERDVREEVHIAKLRGKRPTHEIEYWLKNVEEAAKEMNAIEQELEENNRCFRQCSLNFNSRRKFGKRVHKLIQVVDKLKEKNIVMGHIAVDQLPPTSLVFPTTTLIGKSTAEKTLEHIWDCIMDVKIGRIGVHGMGGVGKTTIMKHVNNRLKEAKLFDRIIWVTVTKNSSLRTLQNKILKALELDSSNEEDDECVSAKLFAAFARYQKYVLILDDILHSFPLEEIGIREPNETNGCKLILTTRSLEVCRRMETQKNIKVNVLSKEEAWDLFRDKAGDVVLCSHLQPIAEQVAKKCGGLLLAIITVGCTFRQVDDVRVWRNALNELKGLTSDTIGIEHELFDHLRFSYNCLRNDMIRACFLYCALYPEDFVISCQQLIHYWVWEGLIDESGNREATNDKGQAILNELKDVCLLESASCYFYEDGVKMHDLIRDMAIEITREKPRFMVKAGLGLNESLKEEEWKEDIERMSLMMNSFQVLPNQPMCPKLSTLFLLLNPQLKIIPPLFFEHMHGLKVINLSFTKIVSLPESLSNLDNLSALLLENCKKLRKVPSVAKLKKLMVLLLHDTAIAELPQGMELLVNLRWLDLSNNKNLHTFPSGVITKLLLLDTLSTHHSGWRWSTDMPNMGGANIDEIIRSKKLSDLHISFLNIYTFNSYVRSGHWRKLESFYFLIGSVKDQPLFVGNNIVEIEGQSFESSTLELPDNTNTLSIQRCHNVANCSESFNFLNLRELTECFITKCNGVEFIITEEITFPRLEMLKVVFLPDLRALCKGTNPCVTFESLKILDIRWCDNLISLFSVQVFQQLQNLEEFCIWRCKLMKEKLVGDEEMDETGNCIAKIKLPRLKHLQLLEMPQLESICKRVICCNSLRIISVSNCPKLRKLPISIDEQLPALEAIEGCREWWDALEWGDPNAKARLQPYLKEQI